MIDAGGGSRCWNKFRELSTISTLEGVSLKLKGKNYQAYVRSDMVYGSETWTMRVEAVQRLKRAETVMEI